MQNYLQKDCVIKPFHQDCVNVPTYPILINLKEWILARKLSLWGFLHPPRAKLLAIILKEATAYSNRENFYSRLSNTEWSREMKRENLYYSHTYKGIQVKNGVKSILFIIGLPFWRQQMIALLQINYYNKKQSVYYCFKLIMYCTFPTHSFVNIFWWI